MGMIKKLYTIIAAIHIHRILIYLCTYKSRF